VGNQIQANIGIIMFHDGEVDLSATGVQYERPFTVSFTPAFGARREETGRPFAETTLWRRLEYGGQTETNRSH
jgi:hypothetical protein